METSIEMGGKIESDRCDCGIALKFEIAANAALRVESICMDALNLLKRNISTDAAFLTDAQIRQKVELIDREFLEGREALIKKLNIHRAHRNIHWNRIQNKQRAQNLKDAEDKYL